MGRHDAEVHLKSPIDLGAAIAGGDLEQVRAALEAGADANAPSGPHGARPLHGACARGELALATLLLEHGADVDRLDDTPLGPLTALMLAVIYDRLEIVELLLDRGASPAAPELADPALAGQWAGWSAIHWAGRDDNLPMLVALLRRVPGAVGWQTAAGLRPYALVDDPRCRALLLTLGQGKGVADFERSELQRAASARPHAEARQRLTLAPKDEGGEAARSEPIEGDGSGEDDGL